MGTQYCLILTTEDGDVSVEVLSREVLLERLNQGYYGAGAHQPRFHAGPPPRDPMQWGQTRALLIQGTVVVPGSEKVVERFTL
jgi:hypothetical protein